MVLLCPLPALLGALLIPFFRSRRARNLWTESVTLLSALLAWIFACMPGALSRGAVRLFRVLPDVTVSFRLDGPGRVFLLLVSFLWPLATLYAFDYMKREEREGTFFTFYTLAFGVTQLLALSANLFTLYLFYECLTLATLPLVTHHEDRESLQAGNLYVRYSIGGAALGFIGLLVLIFLGAAGNFVPGGLVAPEMAAADHGGLNSTLLPFFFFAALLGFSAKAALFPLSGWLPRVSVAPTPVTALLHAVAVVNAGAFAALRLVWDSFGTAVLADTWVREAALFLSGFTIALGAVMAVREQHLKRRLAWSTVSNLSYILFAFFLMTPEGLRAGLAHMIFHSLIKITLFWCAGIFQGRAGLEYMTDLRGAGRKMPLTAVIFTLAGIALIGIPPFPGFLSKWKIASAAIALNTPGAWFGASALILSSVLACIYLLIPAIRMFFMNPSPVVEALGEGRRDAGAVISGLLIFFCAVILFFGLHSTLLTNFLTEIAGAYP